MIDEGIYIHPEIKPLVPGYLENRKKDLLTLKEALTKKELSIIARIAHNIKGTALSYGQKKLGIIATRLEEASNDNSWSEIENNIHEMEITLAEKNGN